MCSQRRHTDDATSGWPAGGTDAGLDGMDTQEKSLDLHTSEAPIETINLNLTINEIGLGECAVNGVLSIYAVERTVSTNPPAKGPGQHAIFMNADFWVGIPFSKWT